MANEVIIDPRYSKYKNAEIEAILDKVHNVDAEPTAESENMISSGAVASALGGYTPTTQMNELLAGKQDKMDEASEQEIRDIVRNWTLDAEPEEEDPGE